MTKTEIKGAADALRNVVRQVTEAIERIDGLTKEEERLSERVKVRISPTDSKAVKERIIDKAHLELCRSEREENGAELDALMAGEAMTAFTAAAEAAGQVLKTPLDEYKAKAASALRPFVENDLELETTLNHLGGVQRALGRTWSFDRFASNIRTSGHPDLLFSFSKQVLEVLDSAVAGKDLNRFILPTPEAA